MKVLKVEDLVKAYTRGKLALDHVSFELDKGECLGLVGESGCGKSTLARCLLKIEPVDSGSILLKGVALERLTDRQVYPHRRFMQIVTQNAEAALNPKLKIKHSLLEPYIQFRNDLQLRYFTPTSETAYVKQLLEAVELPLEVANRYPHELSGGQKQRITIGRAISIEPELMVLDEPTASLDVLSQRSILNLLTSLRETLNLSYLFISHDLAAVSEMSQRILVMKEGQVVDEFATQQLFADHRHAYTKELVKAF